MLTLIQAQLRMQVTKLNDEVLIAEEAIVQLTNADIYCLKEASRKNNRQRIRICAHRTTADSVHEMFFVHAKGTYIRPHKHIGKSESMHVLEGIAQVVFFDDDGKIQRVITLGDYASRQSFYYRIADGLFHTLVISSDLFVFHEVTR